MFDTKEKHTILHDYVKCHNIRLKDKDSTLSKTKTDKHINPVFHTNRQVWYSSILQDFASKKKVMWTRSGYTKPFYDDGKYGVTDLAYYILVDNDDIGNNIVNNLNLRLFKYILKSAKWSGFGNEKVFDALPTLPNKKMTDLELYDHFNLSEEDKDYIDTKC